MTTRRETLIGGLFSLLGLGAQRASPQSAGSISLAGKTALITGSTDGLGREVAVRLGALGASVIVHGRNSERGAEVVREINEQSAGNAVFYRADLASLAEVRALATEVRANHERLDLTINNAGILIANADDGRPTSADGHELTFAINYLSHFLLTRELLPLIEASAPARIVNIASVAQSPIEFDDVMMTANYRPMQAYSQSKLAQIMFTMSLAEQFDASRIAVNSVHPATMMDTNMVRTLGARPMATVDEGAEAVMQLAVSPALNGRSGLYFNGLEESRANAQAYDAEVRARLWALSEGLTAG
jgi:NAD(P)-dependent dehydrogenase (short-subunit alcohol dehydrogenase family)